MPWQGNNAGQSDVVRITGMPVELDQVVVLDRDMLFASFDEGTRGPAGAVGPPGADGVGFPIVDGSSIIDVDVLDALRALMYGQTTVDWGDEETPALFVFRWQLNTEPDVPDLGLAVSFLSELYGDFVARTGMFSQDGPIMGAGAEGLVKGQHQVVILGVDFSGHAVLKMYDEAIGPNDFFGISSEDGYPNAGDILRWVDEDWRYKPVPFPGLVQIWTVDATTLPPGGPDMRWVDMVGGWALEYAWSEADGGWVQLTSPPPPPTFPIVDYEAIVDARVLDAQYAQLKGHNNDGYATHDWSANAGTNGFDGFEWMMDGLYWTNLIARLGFLPDLGGVGLYLHGESKGSQSIFLGMDANTEAMVLRFIDGDYGGPTVFEVSSEDGMPDAGDILVWDAVVHRYRPQAPVGDADSITVIPVGGIASTDVQNALAELDAEKADIAHVHAQTYRRPFLLGGM